VSLNRRDFLKSAAPGPLSRSWRACWLYFQVSPRPPPRPRPAHSTSSSLPTRIFSRSSMRRTAAICASAKSRASNPTSQSTAETTCSIRSRSVTRAASMLFDLYDKTEHALHGKIYHAIGNHDVFGILTESGVAPSDPLFGKKMYRDRIGTPRSIPSTTRAIIFVVLDSIQPTADRQWEARIDTHTAALLSDDLPWHRAGHSGDRHCPPCRCYRLRLVCRDRSTKYNQLTLRMRPRC